MEAPSPLRPQLTTVKKWLVPQSLKRPSVWDWRYKYKAHCYPLVAKRQMQILAVDISIILVPDYDTPTYVDTCQVSRFGYQGRWTPRQARRVGCRGAGMERRVLSLSRASGLSHFPCQGPHSYQMVLNSLCSADWQDQLTLLSSPSALRKPS